MLLSLGHTDRSRSCGVEGRRRGGPGLAAGPETGLETGPEMGPEIGRAAGRESRRCAGEGSGRLAGEGSGWLEGTVTWDCTVTWDGTVTGMIPIRYVTDRFGFLQSTAGQ